MRTVAGGSSRLEPSASSELQFKNCDSSISDSFETLFQALGGGSKPTGSSEGESAGCNMKYSSLVTLEKGGNQSSDAPV